MGTFESAYASPETTSFDLRRKKRKPSSVSSATETDKSISGCSPDAGTFFPPPVFFPATVSPAARPASSSAPTDVSRTGHATAPRPVAASHAGRDALEARRFSEKNASLFFSVLAQPRVLVLVSFSATMRAQLSRRILATRRIAEAVARRSASARRAHGLIAARSAARAAGVPPAFFAAAACDTSRAAAAAAASASAQPGHARRVGSPPGPVTFKARLLGGPSTSTSESAKSKMSPSSNQTPSPGTSASAPKSTSFRNTAISPFSRALSGFKTPSLRRPVTPSGTIPPLPSEGRHQATRPALKVGVFFFF